MHIFLPLSSCTFYLSNLFPNSPPVVHLVASSSRTVTHKCWLRDLFLNHGVFTSPWRCSTELRDLPDLKRTYLPCDGSVDAIEQDGLPVASFDDQTHRGGAAQEECDSAHDKDDAKRLGSEQAYSRCRRPLRFYEPWLPGKRKQVPDKVDYHIHAEPFNNHHEMYLQKPNRPEEND